MIIFSTIPKTFRCKLSAPKECGKTVLLKYLFLINIEIDRLYILGPTGNQYDDLEYKDIVLIKDIKELTPPEKLPEDIKKLMIFENVGAKEPVMNTSVGVDIVIVI